MSFIGPQIAELDMIHDPRSIDPLILPTREEYLLHSCIKFYVNSLLHVLSDHNYAVCISRNKHKPRSQKLNIIITGDLMLNNISENFKMNTRCAKVSVKPFPGATIDDFNDFIKPLARQKPDYIIFHAGTNNLKSDTPDHIVRKNMDVYNIVKSISPSTSFVNSGIIRRNDDPVLTTKVIEVNKELENKSKQKGIKCINNQNITGIGKKGLHPNFKGKEQIAGNFLDLISNI